MRIIFAITLLFFISECYSLKNFESQLRFDKSKIKLVNYGFKVNNKIKLSTVPVKSLKIEPFNDWIAKAIWDGDNYNQTGYISFSLNIIASFFFIKIHLKLYF